MSDWDASNHPQIQSPGERPEKVSSGSRLALLKRFAPWAISLVLVLWALLDWPTWKLALTTQATAPAWTLYSLALLAAYWFYTQITERVYSPSKEEPTEEVVSTATNERSQASEETSETIENLTRFEPIHVESDQESIEIPQEATEDLPEPHPKPITATSPALEQIPPIEQILEEAEAEFALEIGPLIQNYVNPFAVEENRAPSPAPLYPSFTQPKRQFVDTEQELESAAIEEVVEIKPVQQEVISSETVRPTTQPPALDEEIVSDQEPQGEDIPAPSTVTKPEPILPHWNLTSVRDDQESLDSESTPPIQIPLDIYEVPAPALWETAQQEYFDFDQPESEYVNPFAVEEDRSPEPSPRYPSFLKSQEIPADQSHSEEREDSEPTFPKPPIRSSEEEVLAQEAEPQDASLQPKAPNYQSRPRKPRTAPPAEPTTPEFEPIETEAWRQSTESDTQTETSVTATKNGATQPGALLFGVRWRYREDSPYSQLLWCESPESGKPLNFMQRRAEDGSFEVVFFEDKKREIARVPGNKRDIFKSAFKQIKAMGAQE